MSTTNGRGEVVALPSREAVTAAPADSLVIAAAQAIAARGRVLLVLSGGSTPKALFELLATPPYAGRIDWTRTHVFWGDERCVPPDDRSSNYRMAREALLDKVPISPEAIHRMRGEDPPEQAAAAYEADLRALFGGGAPRFDVVLLGMGDNGHTASLFPHLTAVRETSRWVVAEYVGEVKMWRITMTPPSTDVLTTHPIQGGTDDTTHSFAVGIIIQMAAGTALCSGALLAPNLVATARHCVAAIPAGGAVTCPDTKFGAVTSASNIIVSTDASVLTSAAKHIGVSKVIVPSGTDQTAVCGNDIALLILSQNVSLPAYVTPVLDPPMTDHTRYSPTITAIGYGVSSATDMTGASAGTRRIKQDVALACIPNDPTFTNCYPSRSFPMPAAEFASGTATCEGDSGSDAYEQANFDAGRWVGFGVLSRGASQGSTCLGGIYTRFDAWSSLIIDAATQAATAGGYDLPSWAMPGVVADAGTGAGDASTDAGGAAVDAGRADGSATPDASGGGTGGA